MITVCCVRVGTAYGRCYVERLRDMVGRHLDAEHRMLCLTDDPEPIEGVDLVPLDGTVLPKWWGKMAVFDRRRTGPGDLLYFDLDTVITGDLAPLAELQGPFWICRNWSRAAGRPNPNAYGSCIMRLRDGWGQHVWDGFRAERAELMERHSNFRAGDQAAIEELAPDAGLIQDALPGLAVHYAKPELLIGGPPYGAAVICFGGRHKPDNAAPWVAEHWR